MKKHLKNFTLLSLIVAILILIYNKWISIYSNMKDRLPVGNGKFFSWKYGNIYYTKSGKGSPILLIHDLKTFSSSYEWNKVIKKLSRTNTVYAIDLLGCGRSDKPNLTYTNYMYVQLVHDFIKNVIEDKTNVVCTGNSFSFVLMACQLEQKYFKKIIAVSPADLYNLARTPDKRKNALKYAIELPIIGTFIFNIAATKNKLIDILTNEYYHKGHLVSSDIVDAYYQSAHNQDGNGKYLFASIKCYYTNINIVPALKRVNSSICLVGGKEHPYMSDIIKTYQNFNPSVEDAYISNASYLPQLEKPEKFVNLINILVN